MKETHLEMLLPTRAARLQAALFLFFKPLVNHSKISFPFSNVSPLLLYLLLLPSLFWRRALRDAKNPPLALSIITPAEYPHPKFPKLFFHTLSQMPFIPAFLINICTISFFFSFSLGIPYHQPRNSILFNSSSSHEVGSCPS